MCVHPTGSGFCTDCFLSNAARICIDEEFDSAPSTSPFAFSDCSFTYCRRDRVSRFRCSAIDKQNRLAVLDRSLAVCPPLWLWPHGAGGHVIGKCRIIFPYKCWGRDVRVVGSKMAEPVGANRPAYMHELVVAFVFRRKDCDWRLVSIHAAEQLDFTGYPYDPLLHASKNAGCDIVFIRPCCQLAKNRHITHQLRVTMIFRAHL